MKITPVKDERKYILFTIHVVTMQLHVHVSNYTQTLTNVTVK